MRTVGRALFVTLTLTACRSDMPRPTLPLPMTEVTRRAPKPTINPGARPTRETKGTPKPKRVSTHADSARIPAP